MTKQFSFKEIFMFGWAKTKQHAWFIVLTFIISSIIVSAVKFVPVIDAVVSMMVGLSICSLSLLISRDQHFTFEDLYKPLLSAKRVLKFFVLVLLYAVAVTIGTILLVVPGIYIATRFKFFPYIVIENENAKLSELIKMSYRLTAGHFWDVFLFLVVVAIVNIIGAALLMVGLFITVPVSIFASAYVYNKLKASHHHEA